MVRPGLSALKGKLKLEHVLKAKKRIDKHGSHEDTPWRIYAVVFNNNRNKGYKPKEIIRLAYWYMKIADDKDKATIKIFNGTFYERDYYELGFSGGKGSSGANTFLEKLDPNESVYCVGEGDENGMH